MILNRRLVVRFHLYIDIGKERGNEMNTARIYKDSGGDECSIAQIVKREPEWAASRIQAGEEAIEKVKLLQDFAIWMTGCGYDFSKHDYFCKKCDELLK